jgi:GTP-binding protein Era
MDDETQQPTAAAIIALAGAPNAGKSTLLNQILGRRISIATPKPQTTQTRILGIEMFGRTQLIFTDTPGIHEPRGAIHELMVGRARSSISGADLVVWIVDGSKGLGRIDRTELPLLAERAKDRPLIVAINKIDVALKPTLLPMMGLIKEMAPDAECFPLSALRGDSIDPLVQHLISLAPEGPLLFPEDAVTDRPVEFMVAEYIREQLFARLHQELPYRVAVKVELHKRRRSTEYFEASIYVDTDSARKIIIGAGGRNVKAIGTAARKHIEDLVDDRVYLKLDVKVKKNWQDDREFLEELGL